MKTTMTSTITKVDFARLEAMDFDALPASALMAGERMAKILALLGDPVTIVATRPDHEGIPRALRGAPGPTVLPVPTAHSLISAKLDPQANNLAVLGFNSDGALEQFLVANPALRQSPVTLWNQIPLLWFRTDFAPPNRELPSMILVTNGLVPLTWLAQNYDVRVHQLGTAQPIAYDRINWPEDGRIILRCERIRSLHGPSLIHGKSGTRLNPNAWSAWVIDLYQLVYDPRVRAFRGVIDPGGRSVWLTDSTVFGLVLGVLQDAAKMSPAAFPMHEIRERKVQELITIMRVMAAENRETEAEALEHFFRLAIKATADGTITSEALLQHYLHFCAKRNALAYTRSEFLRIAPLRIRQIFGCPLVHSIGTKRGYHGLALATLGAKDEPKEGGNAPGAKQNQTLDAAAVIPRTLGTAGTLGTDNGGSQSEPNRNHLPLPGE
jgi:hypothetical protein